MECMQWCLVKFREIIFNKYINILNKLGGTLFFCRSLVVILLMDSGPIDYKSIAKV